MVMQLLGALIGIMIMAPRRMWCKIGAFAYGWMDVLTFQKVSANYLGVDERWQGYR